MENWGGPPMGLRICVHGNLTGTKRRERGMKNGFMGPSCEEEAKPQVAEG